MKKLIFFVIISLSLQLFSADYKLSDYHLNIYNLISASKYESKIAVLGLNEDYKPFYRVAAVRIFENGKWDSLELKLDLNGKKKDVIATLESRIHYDSTGSLWFGADMMYRYKDGKWNAFFIDDSLKEWRRYNGFCVDINNNLWITTHIFDTKRNGTGFTGYAELLKFDGENFKVITFTNTSVSFSAISTEGNKPDLVTALKDGRVAVHRWWFPENTDFDVDFKNLLIYNQDGTYSSSRIPSICDCPSIKNFPKNVTSMYSDDGKVIWLSLNSLSWFSDGPDGKLISKYCCGGLVRYNDGDWTIFDEKNGLSVITHNYWDDTLVDATPVLRFSKLNNQNYLALAKRTMYSMCNDEVFKPLNLKAIGDNATIIRANDYRTPEDYKVDFRFDDTTSTFPIYIPSIMDYIICDKRVWIITQGGIIDFPLDLVLLDVDDYNDDVKLLSPFPNPAEEFIKIENIKSFKAFRVFDLLGVTQISGLIEGPVLNIDVGQLSGGIYFINLINSNQSQVLKFIKK